MFVLICVGQGKGVITPWNPCIGSTFGQSRRKWDVANHINAVK